MIICVYASHQSRSQEIVRKEWSVHASFTIRQNECWSYYYVYWHVGILLSSNPKYYSTTTESFAFACQLLPLYFIVFVQLQFQQVPVLPCKAHLILIILYWWTVCSYIGRGFLGWTLKSKWSIESVVPPRLVFGHWMSTTRSSWMQYIHGPGPRLNDQKTLCPGQKLLVHMRASFWKELETIDQEMKWMSLNSGSTLSLASLSGETWPSAKHDSSCVSKIKEFASTSMNQQSSKRNLTLIFCRPPTSLESHPKSSKGPIQPIQHSNHQWTTFY